MNHDGAHDIYIYYMHIYIHKHTHTYIYIYMIIYIYIYIHPKYDMMDELRIDIKLMYELLISTRIFIIFGYVNISRYYKYSTKNDD